MSRHLPGMHSNQPPLVKPATQHRPAHRRRCRRQWPARSSAPRPAPRPPRRACGSSGNAGSTSSPVRSRPGAQASRDGWAGARRHHHAAQLCRCTNLPHHMPRLARFQHSTLLHHQGSVPVRPCRAPPGPGRRPPPPPSPGPTCTRCATPSSSAATVTAVGISLATSAAKEGPDR